MKALIINAMGDAARTTTLLHQFEGVNCTNTEVLQTKLISPLLDDFLNRRALDLRATTVISPETVFATSLKLLILMAFPFFR